MRIGIAGWGSEGDLRPLVAIAERLKRAGHSPELVLSPVDDFDYSGVCATNGLRLSIVPKQIPNKLLEICRASQSADPSAVSRAVLDLGYYPFVEEMYEASLALCRRSDVAVGLFSSSYVKAAALKAGTPFACVHYYPGIVPSSAAAPLSWPNLGPLNAVSWAMVHALLDLAFKKPAAKFWESKGLPKVRHALVDCQTSEALNLVGCSPTLYPSPPDWGDRTVMTGDYHLPEEAHGWKPSSGLEAFLAAGEKPILVSLGTMEHLAPQRARELIGEAVKLARVRALVQSKVAEGEGAEGDVYRLRWAPHKALLRHCSAMVLHGGAGTTHAALRGGVPAVFLPFIPEQGFWGSLLQKAGSAVKPINFWKATPQKLAARIREAVGSQAMHTRAQELAAKTASEDGTGAAVAALERVFGGGKRAVASGSLPGA
jgi:UDP:flavonoid glycosyltransferase YjiC (YdhE family)